MPSKIIKYAIAYILIFFAFLLFFSCIGYYIFFFNWDTETINIVMNAIGIVIALVTSIAIYGFAEKIKSAA
ncbi:hypothetical protein EDC48_11522 [Gibbsiella quercinecans]|uniref:Uncharacterized protein n=1 Tax=Gibbsiella quercinecans TaxID=929813 RepID=A0A250B6N8_9GAMM|nr:hypothetical protein AWC35_21950 [Gibbsiella quercinecans]RLM08255.1 hypothetical protein BIY30_13540 [Gibbsiella quercinecans]RLM12464.1 hypothetical protein BIY27_11995 [Gibbsiella quercinecans]TCT85264.1 hypothetical protein EDC48_11522 [Gibbsiella quercinecans]